MRTTFVLFAFASALCAQAPVVNTIVNSFKFDQFVERTRTDLARVFAEGP